jgi:glutaminyl-tRNA synthetase
MKEHLARTGGKVVTRFPPEPNGFLHIGHAKAININFGFAKAHKGITYLRYDDTNPEAEEAAYFEGVLDTVRWLGYEPFKITYSSDHFQRLYEIAVELIKKDKCYVCHCTAEQMHSMRGGDNRGPRQECEHRSRPISESLSYFEKMKNGEFEEGTVTLRMKMDMQNPNPQMWDLVAYRVLYTPHHRTGDKWCIYPTYDYTHCLCDSFEDITHSLCSVEFFLSRESYYWLVDQVGIYKPVQWEFGRLNITNTVLSKRKLNILVSETHVAGWDDPRLLTIPGMMRRGYTAAAVNAFARELGVTTANTTIGSDRLENYVRDHLNQIAPRFFLLNDPLLVQLENVPHDFSISCEIIDKVGNQSRHVDLKKEFYIDSSDFRVNHDANFYRLSPGQTVGLLHAPCPITCVGFEKDSTGKISKLICRYEHACKEKPKTYIQWLGVDATSVELRLYDKLFLSENPSSCPGGWLSDLNPNSLIVLKSALVEKSIQWKKGFTFQAVRVGYFCVDKDTTNTSLVLNRTVTLKEDGKKDE